MKSVTKTMVKRLFPKRKPWSYKGRFGKLLVVGGSLRYSGSPAFVALAAIRTGTDLTLIAAPRRAADIVARFQPDLITEPLKGDYINPIHVGHVLELAEWADALVIGGGLDRNPKTYDAVRSIIKDIKKMDKPCVIDAEALRAVAGYEKLMRSNFVLMPHGDEFHALTGKKPDTGIKQRSNLVASSAKKLRCTILLKGRVDVISDGRDTHLNKTGNPYMTKGGTGDTLAGICGALLAQGNNTINAACAAAWINGAAGDMAVRVIGKGFFVSEMLDFIPKVI